MTRFYYPISGCRFSGTNSQMVDGIMVRNLEEVEFLIIEKSHFIDDLHMEFVLNPPVFCVFDGSGTDPGTYLQEAQNVIRALRLSAPGAIADVDEMMTYVRAGSLNIRDPRLCGRAFYQAETAMSLTTTLCSQATLIGTALRDFNKDRMFPEIDIAEQMFQASYRLAGAGDAERFLLLFSAIEAMFGRNQERHLATLPWPSAAQAASFSGLRPIRNFLAHGKTRQVEVASALEDCIRLLLREAIFAAAQGLQPAEAVGHRLIEYIRRHGFRFAPTYDG